MLRSVTLPTRRRTARTGFVEKKVMRRFEF